MQQDDYNSFVTLKDLLYKAGQLGELDVADKDLRDKLILRLLAKRHPEEVNKIKIGGN